MNTNMIPQTNLLSLKNFLRSENLKTLPPESFNKKLKELTSEEILTSFLFPDGPTPLQIEDGKNLWSHLKKTFREKKDPEILEFIQSLPKSKQKGFLHAMELFSRIAKSQRKKITTPEEAFPFFQDFQNKKQEYFLTLSLDNQNQPLRKRVITKGLVNRTLVHPREVFKGAICDNAVGLIVAHNHPAGTLEPSGDDLDLTRNLQKAGKIIGIPILDHLIVAPSGFYSFQENGLL